MKKKIIFVVILAAFLIGIYSSENAKDVPLADIEKNITSEINTETMYKCNNRQLMQFMGMDYGQFREYFYYKGKEALSVDEILLIKVNDKTQLPQLREACEKRVSSQKKTFESYGPEQVALLKDAVIETKGNYLFYCVSPDASEIEEVVIDAI